MDPPDPRREGREIAELEPMDPPDLRANSQHAFRETWTCGLQSHSCSGCSRHTMLTGQDAHDAVACCCREKCLQIFSDRCVKKTELHNQAMHNQTMHNDSCTTSFRLFAREGGHGRVELPACPWEKMDMWLAEHFMPMMLMRHPTPRETKGDNGRQVKSPATAIPAQASNTKGHKGRQAETPTTANPAQASSIKGDKGKQRETSGGTGRRQPGTGIQHQGRQAGDRPNRTFHCCCNLLRSCYR